MLAPIVTAMVLIKVHRPLSLSRGVFFPDRWPIALARKVLVPKQAKYGLWMRFRDPTFGNSHQLFVIVALS